MSLDPERLAALITKAIAVATAPLTARIAQLERTAAMVGRNGSDGPPGPQGPQGEPGAIGPQGLTGPAGSPGEPGPMGERGGPGDVGPAGPEGPAGRDGRDGLPGVPGGQGQKGDVGAAGRDGIDGKDGVNGRDGTLEHVTFQQQADLRTIHVCRKDTDEVLGVWTFPVVLDRGVYDASKTYAAGDAVTYGGHLWIAQIPTAAQPTEFAKAGQNPWRLAVSRGKQGKEGPRGAEGLPGKPGPQGPQGRSGY